VQKSHVIFGMQG